MMAVTLSLRIGRSGSLVTIITKSVSTPKSCSPGSTDTLAVKELPAGMRCPGTSVVAILPLVSTARTTSSALPVFESVKVRSCLGAPCFTGPNLIIFSIICAFMDNDTFHRVVTIIACTSIVITAVYILRVVGKILYGTCTNEAHLRLSDATWDERLSVVCLVVAIAGMGLAPLWASDMIRGSVSEIITHLMN